MEEKNVIKINYLKEVDIEMIPRDAIYAFDNREMPEWIYKILWWFLRLIGFKPINDKEYIPGDVIAVDDIIALIAQNSQIVERVYKRTPAYLLLGSDAIQQLGLRFKVGAFTFPLNNISGALGTTKYNHLGGMRVITIPWMKGVLVLPEVLENEDSLTKGVISVVGEVPNVPSI